MKEFSTDAGSMFDVKYDRPKKTPAWEETDTETRSKTVAPEEKINISQNFECKHRVRWMDEDLGKTMAMERKDDIRKNSDSSNKSGEPKPILKHKARCTVVVSGN
ncbi:hypothetical protein CHS0354_011008 [Potamilus streckersoni]|uniref:Uncharacterized protein n=1 Tax=Potamilus streckersoni TaxID=2493646 RepID=A0AAE0TKV6_9BIVA|nr:hypothetical protein CHS0354_011008 [Potamilus streckersoni]